MCDGNLLVDYWSVELVCVREVRFWPVWKYHRHFHVGVQRYLLLRIVFTAWCIGVHELHSRLLCSRFWILKLHELLSWHLSSKFSFLSLFTVFSRLLLYSFSRERMLSLFCRIIFEYIRRRILHRLRSRLCIGCDGRF